VKKKIADEWIKALRAGRYRQGRKALNFRILGFGFEWTRVEK